MSTAGTLNLGSFNLTASSLNFGSSSQGFLTRTTGILTLGRLSLASSNSLTMLAGDTVSAVTVSGGATLTTA